MSDPVNFVLVPSGVVNKTTPEVPRPPCIRALLDFFETFCVVGCCDWGALDFSEGHLQGLVSTGRSSLPNLRRILEEVIHWSATIQQPVIIKEEGWFFDPEEARKELGEVLVRLEEIVHKNATDPTC